jgi:hypothetical protein
VDERPERVPAPSLAGVLGGEWRKLMSGTVGEFELRQLFDLVGGTRPGAGAEGWAGAHYDLWHRGKLDGECESPCVERDVAHLRVRWDTRRERREGEREFVRVWEHGLNGKRLGARGGVGAWSSRGGAIVMRGRDRETTVVLAPAASLAARVIASAG